MAYVPALRNANEPNINERKLEGLLIRNTAEHAKTRSTVLPVKQERGQSSAKRAAGKPRTSRPRFTVRRYESKINRKAK